MEENKDEHISISITEDNYENVELTRNAIIIISMLNLNYWVTDPEEKEKLLRIYQENDRKFLNKVPNYKNSDWLSNNREEKSFEKPKNETKYLINIEQQSIFTKVINFIKKYKEGLDETYIKKINAYIRMSEQHESSDNGLLELDGKTVNWSYR